ncbi:hypothetical protein F4779DRAFT_618893 [Xylariaceae sp. FL0662B]|nr:hypothetical protein F4779DRAFT_618893 [Xylariaceae sp. FL0662B]
MFRLFRSPRGILRLGARVHGTQGPQPQVIQIQRVKIRRKWFKPMRFVIAAGIYYGCYQIYTISVFGTLGKWLDQQMSQMSKKEREEIEAEEADPMFIPFPLTTKMVEPLPYRSTDPEWQEFVKISRNDKLMGTVRDNLAELALRAVKSHPILIQKCGTEARVGKRWLDIQFPAKPPPTFTRKGLTIDDDGIFVEEQPVDSLTVFRIQRALWPSALTLSLWSFSMALMKQNAITIAKSLGFEVEPPNHNLQQTMERIHQQLKKPPVKADSQVPRSLSKKTQAADGASTDSASAVGKGSTAAPGPPSASGTTSGSSTPSMPNAESGKPKSAKDIYTIKLTQEHTNDPWQAFKQKFAQTWRPISGFPPRGSINISGIVEILTPRAILTVDVDAWWDPKTEKFDGRTLSLRLRALRMRTQSPLR